MLEKGVDAGAAAVGGWNGYLGAREGIRKGAGGVLVRDANPYRRAHIHSDGIKYHHMGNDLRRVIFECLNILIKQ